MSNSPIVNALSVDVEDYFQVENFADQVPRDSWGEWRPRVEQNTHRLLDLFDRRGVRGTFFILGWVAEHFPALVRQIDARGHEVACHSYMHRLVYDLTRDEFREDTHRCKALLEDLVGKPVVGYRAPSYSITDRNLWALDVLAELGFVYDSSIFPVHHDRYGIPDFPRWPVADYQTPGGQHIHEFPLTTFRMVGHNMPAAGGGYLRILPMPWTHHGIRAANRAGRPAILYIHPWEIDDGQPRVEGLPFLRHMRCYYNLKGTFDRLDDVLSKYRWSTVAEVLGVTIGREIISPAGKDVEAA
jgi:polysaccharide deacetylase family protein (PEP-CTERM system associated)